jgi:hypothetical protein
MIQRMIEQEREQQAQARQQEKKRLQEVLKSWLNLDWGEEDQERLAGGYSGATVLRIRPKLRIPADNGGGYQEASIPHLETVIIKYGKKANFDAERQNYASIPTEYRHHFAAIPQKAHNDVWEGEVYEYLVIEDLIGYRTLQEVLFPTSHAGFRKYVAQRLGEFLSVLYSMPPTTRKTAGMLRSLYITPMFHSLDAILEFAHRTDTLDEEELRLIHELDRYLDRLVAKSAHLERFPLCVMHGDLNIRNILFNGRQVEGADVRFRLIDLDKFTRAGDVACDIGEFIIDMQVVAKTQDYSINILDMCDMLEQAFCLRAQERNDPLFGLRLDISKARSLLKFVEIQAKRGLVDTGASSLARNLAMRRFSDAKPFLLEAHRLVANVAEQIASMT